MRYELTYITLHDTNGARDPIVVMHTAIVAITHARDSRRSLTGTTHVYVRGVAHPFEVSESMAEVEQAILDAQNADEANDEERATNG